MNVVLCVFMIGIALTAAQQIQVPPTGGVISISTDQPCINVDSTKSSTSGMLCTRATILQLGLQPSQTNTTSGFVFQFISLPDTTGAGKTTFDGSGDQTTYSCSDSGGSSQQCIGADGEDLITVTVNVSPIVGRYTLEPTGVTLPSAYYYNTTSFPYSNHRRSFDECRVAEMNIDTANRVQSDCQVQSPEVTKHFFPDIAGDVKQSVFSQTVSSSGCFTPAILSTVAKTLYFPAIPDPDGLAVFYDYPQVSGEPISSIGNVWPDDVYRRWYRGLLGTGGEVVSGLDIPPAGVCDSDDVYSQCPCVTPIAVDSDDLRATTAVCLGSFVEGGYGLRNGKTQEATYCIPGSCAGSEEAQCPFTYGFTYGSSRCLGSQSTASEMYSDPPTSGLAGTCDADCGSSDDFRNGPDSCFGRCDDTENVCDGVPTDDLTLDEIITQRTCYCAMRKARCGRADPTSFAYPSFNDLFYTDDDDDNNSALSHNANSVRKANQWNRLKMCSNYNNAQTQDPSNSNTAKKNQNSCCATTKCAGDQCGGIDDEDDPFYECGVDSDGDVVNCKQSRLADSPCSCSCQSAWQDIVKPVNPLCTLYRLVNPAAPMFNVTVTTKTNNGTTTQSITVGTSVLINTTEGTPTGGGIKHAVTADGKVSLSLLNIDKPNGAGLPRLDGYIVICGDRSQGVSDSDVDIIIQSFRNASFVGSPSPLGTTNPFQVADPTKMDVSGRTPIPSTWGQFEDAGVLENISRTFLGNNSIIENGPKTGEVYKGQPTWWYYVPPGRTRNYGQGCNQIGWNNYGHYDMPSASSMCTGRTGTCVPGYDLRGASNLSEAMLKPDIQVPAFVGRQFVNYEVEWARAEADGTLGQTAIPIPDHLPPGWNPAMPNYWVDSNFLYTDTDALGNPAFSAGDILIRINVGVAGTLLQAGTSLSAGKLYYMNGVTAAPTGDPLSTDNSALGNCVIGLATQRGTIIGTIQNTGQTPATYSVRANCTGGVFPILQPTNIGVNPGSAGVQYSIGIEVSSDNPLQVSPTCLISLIPADIEGVILDQLNYVCSLTNNVNFGVGTIVLGNALPADGGPGPIWPGRPEPDRGGSSFWDLGFSGIASWLGAGIGGIAGWMDFVFMWIVYVVLALVVILFAVQAILRMNEATLKQVETMRAMREGARISAAKAEQKVRAMKKVLPSERKKEVANRFKSLGAQ
jgi:hypothetical protein